MSTRRGAEEANRESRETAQSRDLHEVKDRLRRMETRLVKLMEHMGFDSERKMPTVTAGQMKIPSMQVAFADIIAAIPEGASGAPIAIWHKNVCVARIVFPPWSDKL